MQGCKRPTHTLSDGENVEWKNVHTNIKYGGASIHIQHKWNPRGEREKIKNRQKEERSPHIFNNVRNGMCKGTSISTWTHRCLQPTRTQAENRNLGSVIFVRDPVTCYWFHHIYLIWPGKLFWRKRDVFKTKILQWTQLISMASQQSVDVLTV